MIAATHYAQRLNTGQWVTVTCCRCAINFQMPQGLYDVRRVDSATFWCPLGHEQHYPAGKSERELLKEQLAQAERMADARSRDLQRERASHSATKGQLTKAKKRAANGVCPCCSRSFVNVSRHMQTMHPDFVEQTKA